MRAVDSLADLRRAVTAIGLPGVLKTRRLGYDGKGQFVLRRPADVDRHGPNWGRRRCSTKSWCRSTTKFRLSVFAAAAASSRCIR